MPPPQLSEQQRRDALAKAAEARRMRAEIKDLLKMGSISFPELLAKVDRDDIVAGIKVSSVLESMPGLGKVKAKRLMEQHGIAETRRLRGLGERQRAALLSEFS
jgi:hypothetical protein